MSNVLIYGEIQGGLIKKSSKELATFGKMAADAIGGECYAVLLGQSSQASSLGAYGVAKVYHDTNPAFDSFDDRDHATALAACADKCGADLIIVPHSSNGRAILGRLAIKLNAGSVSGVNRPIQSDGGSVIVEKAVFSGKAQGQFRITSDKKVISLMGNSVQPSKTEGTAVVEALSLAAPQNRVKVLSQDKATGSVPLPEAERVVSAGRGMKDPSNWGIIEELAEALDAATACSRPVADSGWRPHHEHVGQTGVAIRPNLYVAIGISGAIQHLAGVNNSKTIVVINKDPEAPFFKAADYGVCGDLFEVVPRLTEAVKKYKAQS